MIDSSKMVSLVYGACYLASGGGGPLKVGLKFAEEIKNNHVQLIKPGFIPKGHSAVIVADLGSPQAIFDDPTNKLGRSAAINATREMIQYAKTEKDSTLSVIYPIEIGAVNAIIPFYVAAKLGLTVMDADICGRSVPFIYNTILAANNVPCCPANITTDTGNDGLIEDDTKSNHSEKQYLVKSWNEENMTTKKLNTVIKNQLLKEWKLKEMIIGLNIWYTPDPNDESFVNLVNKFTLETAIKLGEVFTSKTIVGEARTKPLREILAAADGQGKKIFDLFSGNLTYFKTEQAPGGVIDLSRVVFTNQDSKKEFVVYGLNENLIAYNLTDKKLVAMAPDGITFLDENYQPLDVTSIAQYKGSDMVFYIQGIECWNNMSQGKYSEVMFKTVTDCAGCIEKTFGDKWSTLTEYIPIADLQSSGQCIQV